MPCTNCIIVMTVKQRLTAYNKSRGGCVWCGGRGGALQTSQHDILTFWQHSVSFSKHEGRPPQATDGPVKYDESPCIESVIIKSSLFSRLSAPPPPPLPLLPFIQPLWDGGIWTPALYVIMLDETHHLKWNSKSLVDEFEERLNVVWSFSKTNTYHTHPYIKWNVTHTI